MYKTLVRLILVLTQASEARELSSSYERSLGLFERRVLRHIFGAVKDKSTWRTRYKHELCKLFNEPDNTKYIKVNGLSWAGHIIRMENSRTVKKVFDIRPEGTRKFGRPRLRWEDGLIQNIRPLGVKNWNIVAMNRKD
jgi:hypothetical protein